ncbi:helix-turn-helix domain-containing protein [Rhizobium mayense]|uniref:Helix-turn-helix domain-containing protein n=1 Tax=Rhizobium mayense TaxID=1312184 RepID=A0ABT7K0E6_9HYPH|nr:helix-turn-helix domain-containing protein [Rhizobium mayense]MDL2402070.1 helix-turn-helix domain-containing protein [Rhizobium mayense]
MKTCFTQIAGMPPIDYISRWRMLLGKDALTTSDLSMTEITQLIDFQSVSSFSTWFNCDAVTPPSAYCKEPPDLKARRQSNLFLGCPTANAGRPEPLQFPDQMLRAS